jgi:capsular exopolysaccharide synthesis family protein
MSARYENSEWNAIEEIDLRAYLSVFSRRRRTLYLAVGGAFLLTLLGTLAQTPSYLAKTTLQIEPDTPKILDFQEMFQVDSTNDAFYQTQYRLVESRSLAERVILEAGLDNDPLFNAPPSIGARLVGAALGLPKVVLGILNSNAGRDESEADAEARERDAAMSRHVSKFLDRLNVSPIRNTRLAEISWTSPSAQQAAVVTRAIADNYIAMNLEAKFETTQAASAFLAAEVDQLQKEIAAAEAELQRYGTEQNILSDSEEQDVVSQQLVQLNQELTRVRSERVRTQANYDSVRGADPSSLAEVRTNRVVEGLKQDLADIRQRRTEMSRRFTDDWPEMQDLTNQIDDIEGRIGEEEAALQAAIVQQARAEFAAARDREQQVDALLAQATRNAANLNESLIAYRSLQTRIQSRNQTLESLLERQSETGVSARLQGSQTSNIRVIDEAAVPLEPFSPNLPLNLLFGLIGGLVLGIGTAVVQEYLDNTLKSAEDVERLLGVPNLAIVPAAGSASRGGYGYAADARAGAAADPETVVQDHPRSTLAEAYRGLRSAVMLSRAGQPPQVIAVTSAEPGEGKTTTAANLAQALAQAGKKTLFMDADLRRPRGHTVFGIAGQAGLVTHLTGGSPLEEAVAASRVPNLWVLPCGPLPPNPSELLGAAELKTLVQSLRSGFDAIVIDTPPVLAVVDAIEVAALADGIIIVARADETVYQQVGRAVRQVTAASDYFLGVVLNGVDTNNSGYYGAYARGYAARQQGNRASRVGSKPAAG